MQSIDILELINKNNQLMLPDILLVTKSE